MTQLFVRCQRFYWLLLLIPPLLMLLAAGSFPYPGSEAQFSDFAITHYPYTLTFQRSLAQGQWPWWSSNILSGAPLAANPLAGVWYPPGWVALLFPLPSGLNLAVALHGLWAGLGMLRLLRKEGLGPLPAVWGALMFEVLPKAAAHYGAGHVTLLYALSWTPWLLLVARRPAGAGVVLALTFLADPRWAVYAGMLWLAYLVAGERFSWAAVRRLAVSVVQSTAWAAALAAPLWLPMLQLARLSTRSALTQADSLVYSLPWARLLGLFYPDLGGFHEYMLYIGQAGLLLALVALLGGAAALDGARLSRKVFWGVAALVSLLLALGDHLPLLAWVWRLPLLDWLRVPARALFIFGMAAAVLSAYGLQAMLSSAAWPRRLRLVLTLVAGLSVALAAAVLVITSPGASPATQGASKTAPFAWGLVGMIIALGWLAAYFWPRLPRAVWLGGLLLIGMADCLGVGGSLVSMRSAKAVLGEGAPAAAYLAAQPGWFRIYSPSYSLPQQTAAYYGLELADGVDPLQLKGYAAFMQPATGVSDTAYSVTLPPFANGDPATANAASTPDAQRLGWLNVRYVAAEFDVHAPGLVLEKQFGQTRVYRNLRDRGRAWLDGEEGNAFPAVDLQTVRPGRLELSVPAGRLVMSEVAAPGWRVEVNGAPVDWQSPSEAPVLSVMLDAPINQVRVVYRPWWAWWGLALAGLALAARALAAVRDRAGRARRGDDE